MCGYFFNEIHGAWNCITVQRWGNPLESCGISSTVNYRSSRHFSQFCESWINVRIIPLLIPVNLHSLHTVSDINISFLIIWFLLEFQRERERDMVVKIHMALILQQGPLPIVLRHSSSHSFSSANWWQAS